MNAQPKKGNEPGGHPAHFRESDQVITNNPEKDIALGQKYKAAERGILRAAVEIPGWTAVRGCV